MNSVILYAAVALSRLYYIAAHFPVYITVYRFISVKFISSKISQNSSTDALISYVPSIHVVLLCNKIVIINVIECIYPQILKLLKMIDKYNNIKKFKFNIKILRI